MLHNPVNSTLSFSINQLYGKTLFKVKHKLSLILQNNHPLFLPMMNPTPLDLFLYKARAKKEPCNNLAKNIHFQYVMLKEFLESRFLFKNCCRPDFTYETLV